MRRFITICLFAFVLSAVLFSGCDSGDESPESEHVGNVSGTVVVNSSANDNDGCLVCIAGTSYMATTAADGTFTISNVPAGTDYALKVAVNGLFETWKTVSVAAGETVDAGTRYVWTDGKQLFEGEVSMTAQSDGNHFVVAVPENCVRVQVMRRTAHSDEGFVTSYNLMAKTVEIILADSVELVDCYVDDGKEYEYWIDLENKNSEQFASEPKILKTVGGFGEMGIENTPAATFANDKITVTTLPEFAPAKIPAGFERAVSSESIRYYKKDSDGNKVYATAYIKDTPAGTPLSFSNAAQLAGETFVLDGFRYGVNKDDEYGCRHQMWRYIKKGDVPKTIAFSGSSSSDDDPAKFALVAGENGITASFVNFCSAYRIKLERFEDGFKRPAVQFESRAEGMNGNSFVSYTAISVSRMTDYYVVPGKTYIYKLSFFSKDGDVYGTSEKEITAVGGLLKDGDIQAEMKLRLVDKDAEKTTVSPTTGENVPAAVVYVDEETVTDASTVTKHVANLSEEWRFFVNPVGSSGGYSDYRLKTEKYFYEEGEEVERRYAVISPSVSARANYGTMSIINGLELRLTDLSNRNYVASYYVYANNSKFSYDGDFNQDGTFTLSER